MRHRLALFGATLAISAPVGIVAASPASAASYPSSVTTAYQTSCVKTAKKKLGTRKAKTLCKATLKCVERKLTLSQFEKFAEAALNGDKTPPHAAVVERCVKQAAGAA